MSVKRRVVIEEDEEEVYEEVSASDSDDVNNEEVASHDDDDDGGDADSENDVSENDENAGTVQGNAGWADSIAKILKTNKPKGKKTLVLSKAKKLTDIKKDKTKYVGFETITEAGEVNKEVIVEDKEPEKSKEKGPVRKKKRELPNLRVKPNILEKDRERTLAKVATKGVVQLFNAVRMQQKDINKKLKEAGPLEVRKEKVLKNIDKRSFLDVLMGEKSQPVDEPLLGKTETISRDNEKQKDSSSWNVLRDDFMMSAKMKDWDKELEKEIEIEDVEME